jgi:hypothetical protein
MFDLLLFKIQIAKSMLNIVFHKRANLETYPSVSQGGKKLIVIKAINGNQNFGFFPLVYFFLL